MAEMVPAVLSPARRGREDRNGDCGRHDSVNESLKSNDSVEISGFMIIRFGQKIMKQYDLANNLIHFFSSMKKIKSFQKNKKFLCERTKNTGESWTCGSDGGKGTSRESTVIVQ